MTNRRGKSGNNGGLYFWGGSNITADMILKDACSLEDKLTNLDNILKSRDCTLLAKVHLVKALFFPVVMYGHESWTIKKLSIKELMLLNCGVGEDS